MKKYFKCVRLALIRPAHAGNWDFKTIKSGDCSTGCPDNKPCAVIGTYDECGKAWGTDVLMTTEQVLPYCYIHDGVGFFDSTGMEEGQGERSCSENYACQCKQGTVHTTDPLLHLDI